MKTLSYFIETHGCQMNEHDSEKISGLLIQYGMLPAPAMGEADLIILNTCSVREKASHKVFSRLGELKPLKAKHPGLIIGVAGCVAQQEGDAIIRRAPHVDLVVGTHQYHALPDILDQLLDSRRAGRSHEPGSQPVVTGFVREASPAEIQAVKRNTSFRANITIMEGCNKQCAYCIVPFTRGRERNRRLESILEEAASAVEQGYSEIQLLGQTVTNYRDPTDETRDFTRLLDLVSGISGIRRLRFVSPHPINFNDDLIALIAERDNICNQIHLPLQSGSNTILKRMRRLHTREWYLELVEKFRGCGRPVALSTDMIVGFPGETEADFEDTLDAVEKSRYEQMYSFKYSIRPHTEAAEWGDDISEEIKSRRLSELQERQKRIQLDEYRRNYLGGVFEVLVEGKARDGKALSGRTTTNKVVNFISAASPGEYIKVKIERVSSNSLYGKEITSDLIRPEFLRNQQAG